MYVFAALARTTGDINYPSGEKLDHNLLLLFPYKLQLQIQWNNVGFSFKMCLQDWLPNIHKQQLTD